MLNFNILYWNLMKFPYFVDTIERRYRGWKEAQKTRWKHGHFMDNSNICHILV